MSKRIHTPWDRVDPDWQRKAKPGEYRLGTPMWVYDAADGKFIPRFLATVWAIDVLVTAVQHDWWALGSSIFVLWIWLSLRWYNRHSIGLYKTKPTDQ